MRHSAKKAVVASLPALAAAAFSTCVATPSARAGFEISVLSQSATALPGYVDVVVGARNDGLDGTGTTLIAVYPLITTPGTGTTGALYIDTSADIDGDGQADADITGAPDGTFGTATPTFGGTALNGLGTFIGIPASRTSLTADVSLEAVPAGSVAPSPYETSLTPDGLTSELDPNYLDGTVHSLTLACAIISASFKGPNDQSFPAPFANIVVPMGTPVTISGQIAGNSGPIPSFSFNFIAEPVPEPAAIGALALGALCLRARARRRKHGA